MQRTLRILIACLLVLMTLVPARIFAQAFKDYRWTMIEAEGEAAGRHENAFVEYDGRFYMIGGRGILPVNVFDPETNTWETRAETPMEMHHFQAVVYNDAIYIVGAMTGGYPEEQPLDHIWIYYPESDRWEKGPEIPAERRRGGAGAVLYHNKIYLVGGIEYGHTSGTNNYFDSFDPKTGEWQILPKAPHVRDHFPAIVVQDNLYCVGGRNTSVHHPDQFTAFFEATVSQVDVYNFREGKWHTMKNHLPFPSAAGGLVSFNGHLIYMGGEGSYEHAYFQTQCLDLESGRWTSLSPMVTGRHGTGAILQNGNIYVAGGSHVRGGGNKHSIEVFSAEHAWESLFNGKNLNGWEVKYTPGDADKQYWRVDQGSIVCNTKGNTDHQYIWLQSQEEFGDFELRLQFQVSRQHRGNSGIQVRSRYDETARVDGEVAGWLDGPQIDIEPQDPWRNGLIYDETRGTRRWIFPDLPDWNISEGDIESRRVIFYWEDEGPGWNDVRIICRGNRIQSFVNNIRTADFDGSGILDDADHVKHGVSEQGHIALQLHKGSDNLIRFRGIEIRELSPFIVGIPGQNLLFDGD